MYNIQFSLSDMKRRWFELFFIVIQMTIAMLLFCYSISIILDGMKAIDILESSKIKSYDFKLTVILITELLSFRQFHHQELFQGNQAYC